MLVSILLTLLSIYGCSDSSPLPQARGKISIREHNTSDDPRWSNCANFRSAVLARHNQYRKAHSVPAVTWNETLSDYAVSYLDSKGRNKNTCPSFSHSGGPFGENLALGYETPTLSVTGWGEEREAYDFEKPGFASGTGHFTQLVWKDTKSIGCARKYCTDKNVPFEGWYLVCEYYPAGNIVGQFDGEVLKGRYEPKQKDHKPVKEKDDGDKAGDKHGNEDEDEDEDEDDGCNEDDGSVM